MNQNPTYRAAADRNCQFPQFSHDPPHAPAGIFTSQTEDQLPQPPAHALGPADLTGCPAALLFTNPSAIGLDGDNLQDIIHGMAHGGTSTKQPKSIPRRKDDPVAGDLLAKQLDLKPEELKLGIPPHRPSLGQEGQKHLKPSRQHDSSLRRVRRKCRNDRCPIFWTTSEGTQGPQSLPISS